MEKKFDRDELCDRIYRIVHTMGERIYLLEELVPFLNLSTGFYVPYRYHDNTFQIRTHPQLEIKYNQNLVFRDSEKRSYHKSGEWEKEFNRLYTKSLKTKDFLASEY